jgi:hypothetical protein
LDPLQLVLKVADLGVATLAITALVLALQALRRMIDQLDALQQTDRDQTDAIKELIGEVRKLRPVNGSVFASERRPYPKLDQ